MKLKIKKTVAAASAVIMTSSLVIGMTGCGGSDDSSSKSTTKASQEDNNGGSSDSQSKSIADLKLGEDGKDLKTSIKILTNRTDLVDTKFADYVKKFNETYPNIEVKYEGLTDYDTDITTRLTADDWGDICMIPGSVDKKDLSSKFISFGKTDELSKKYSWLADKSYDGESYGIPSAGTARGIVYNKKVFEKAGITELPKTPDDFLDALKKIKDTKSATYPLYTNFAAGWTMGAWDDYIDGTATGDPDFKNNIMCHQENPFTYGKDKKMGPYYVYYVLYNAIKDGLTEEDLTGSDWESSKGKLNRGEIGCMVLGNWSVIQMQQADKNPDDIGYMPFPITVNGKQYSGVGGDYNYGINCKSDSDKQLAAELYVKFLVEESGYANDQSMLSTVVGSELPEALASFKDVELISQNAPKAGEEDLFSNINAASELGIGSGNDNDQRIAQAAKDGSETLDDIINDWNEKWKTAQESCDALNK